MRGEDGSPVAKARRGLPIEQTLIDDLPSALPRWRKRAVERSFAPAEPARGRTALAPSDEREFQADRRAARYAPDGAVFAIRDRPLPVLTVSMSGLSVEWDAVALPPAGTTIDGWMRTDGPQSAFRASMQVVRLEPARRLVAGRFVGLAGPSIDRLLAWLVLLERAGAGKD